MFNIIIYVNNMLNLKFLSGNPAGYPGGTTGDIPGARTCSPRFL
jgi:hypothetical protein